MLAQHMKQLNKGLTSIITISMVIIDLPQKQMTGKYF